MYSDTVGSSTIRAVDQVLAQLEPSTTLAVEFPKFTWNNYFMNTGTYDIQVTGVYTNLAILPPAFTGPEWKLFRSFLLFGRDRWQDGNAGVFIQSVKQYPVDGSQQVNPEVGKLGAVYIEFYPPIGLNDLHLTLVIRKRLGEANPKVSVIPIGDFQTHPANIFIDPVADDGLNPVYDYTYNNFNLLNRVAVIVSSVGGPIINYSYSADIVTH